MKIPCCRGGARCTGHLRAPPHGYPRLSGEGGLCWHQGGLFSEQCQHSCYEGQSSETKTVNLGVRGGSGSSVRLPKISPLRPALQNHPQFQVVPRSLTPDSASFVSSFAHSAKSRLLLCGWCRDCWVWAEKTRRIARRRTKNNAKPAGSHRAGWQVRFFPQPRPSFRPRRVGCHGQPWGASGLLVLLVEHLVSVGPG
jgi:hypothetical protein